MDSAQIESAAQEAINRAIESGYINRYQVLETESIVERLYMVLNEYVEETIRLKKKLRNAKLEITRLRKNGSVMV